MIGTYLRLGYEHLLDRQGYDHILFIAVLCAAYAIRDWKPLLILITAFTIGHSISLALATMGLIRMDTGLIEFLIPVTIVAAAVINIVRPPPADPGEGAGSGENGADREAQRTRMFRYVLALLFGVIHGMGFSNFLRLMLGDEASLFVPLLSFNIGLELGQILVAVIVLVSGVLLSRLPFMNEQRWSRLVSGTIGLVAAWMAMGRWPW